MPHDFTFLDTEFVEVRGGYNKKVIDLFIDLYEEKGLNVASNLALFVKFHGAYKEAYVDIIEDEYEKYYNDVLRYMLLM
jgi:hypothetical protein